MTVENIKILLAMIVKVSQTSRVCGHFIEKDIRTVIIKGVFYLYYLCCPVPLSITRTLLARLPLKLAIRRREVVVPE